MEYFYFQARKAIRYSVCLSNSMTILSRQSAWRTKPCRYFANTGVCTKGDKCNFAHRDKDGNDVYERYDQAACDELHTSIKCYTGLTVREQRMSEAAFERQAAFGRKVREDLRQAAFERKMREDLYGSRGRSRSTGSTPATAIGAKRGRRYQRAPWIKKWPKSSTAASSTVQGESHTWLDPPSPLAGSQSSIGSSNSRSPWNVHREDPAGWLERLRVR